MADTWVTDRTVRYVRTAERISGVGYEIRTDVVDVTQDGETRRMMRVTSSVLGDLRLSECYVPEGACGIRTDATERARVACIRELASRVPSLPSGEVRK